MADYTEKMSADQLYPRQKDKDMERVSETAHVTGPRTWESDETNAISQVLINELSESYFNSVQYYFPIVNRSRYLQKIETLPHTHELKSLNYAIWAHGALCSNKHESVVEMCYLQSRSLLEQAEMAPGGTSFLTLEALQACLLIAVYENKRMFFSRAWITVGRALRLAQIMKLHLMDSEPVHGSGEVPLGYSLPSEERRTAFWVGFVIDRCMSNGQDWPMIFEHNLKMIHLPSAEHVGADDVHTPVARYQATPCLDDYLASPFPPPMPLFAYVVVASAVWGRCMKHFQQSSRTDAYMGAPGDFWTRHHEIENHVMQISTAAGLLPSTPHSADPNAVFLSMMLQTINIYLSHSAAAYALRNGLSGPMGLDSDASCDIAAMKIAGSARAFSALNLYSKMNLFAAQCLYAAARVLVESIKSLRGDARSLDSLHSILGAMDAWKRENPLVELYIQRISQDLEGNEMSDLMLMPY